MIRKDSKDDEEFMEMIEEADNGEFLMKCVFFGFFVWFVLLLILAAINWFD